MYSYNFLSIQFTLMILSIMASAPSYMRLQTLLSTIFIDSIRSLGEFPSASQSQLHGTTLRDLWALL